MPKVKDRILISIGVSKPQGGLEELPGVITATERMAAWAEAQGYETVLIHDAILPEITVELLREKILEAIQVVTNQTALQRLIVFFAGHGCSPAFGDQYWILSNWNSCWNEAIKVSSFKRALEYYGPKQVAVISDACQEVSSRFGNILGSPVLQIPDENPQNFELDQFFAAGYGKQAFMIKARDQEQAYCLFTEVLLDALEGDVDSNYLEEIHGDKAITSDSLKIYLQENIPRLAGKHGLTMEPHLVPGFRTDRVYLAIPSHSIPIRRLSMPLGASVPPAEEVFGFLDVAPDLSSHQRSVDKVTLVEARPIEGSSVIDISTLDQDRKVRRQNFIEEVGKAVVRNHFETNCGICVSGADVADVAMSFGISTSTDEQPDWYRVQLDLPEEGENFGWSDALVTLAGGRVVPVCAIHTFVASLHIVDDAEISLFHHLPNATNKDINMAITLLGELHAGLLTSDEIINSATKLRQHKHRIITVGCIAAQFYDAIRDVDSLRSMAAFYAMNRQPVPIDIILYGGGIINEQDGRLYADIPAVAERKARTAQEESEHFTYMETPAFKNHPIAGRIPWMRHAWGAIETARCEKSASGWQQQASAVMKYLAPGIFTVVTAKGRDAMFELAGIKID